MKAFEKCKKSKNNLLFILFLSAILIIFSVPVNAHSSENINVNIDGQQILFDIPPIISNGRTLVPMRKIFEELGFAVTWREKSQTITGIKDNLEIIMDIGSVNVYKNDILFQIESPPVIIDSRTFVPLRFIAESTEADVVWDESSKTVNIYTTKNPVKASPADSVVMISTNRIQGSGVVLSSDGLIVTNFHIIEGATKITIIFNNTKMYTGEVFVVGYDISRDLAILKIDVDDLTPAKLGNSNNININDTVTAIGSPLGIMNVLSNGKILSLDKNIISTTTKIDHGSSGGALFNSSNELIGITSAYTSNNDYFSIPINYVGLITPSGRIPLSVSSKLKPEPVTPQGLTIKYTDSKVSLAWEPMYGVDYFYLYKSDTIDGNYKKVQNPTNNSYKWNWGYPSSFSLSNSEGLIVYFRIASVKDGFASPLSSPVEIKQ